MNVRNLFITYIIPGIAVILLQLLGLSWGFGAGLACGGSGGPAGCDGLVLAAYFIVSAPITGFGIMLLFTGNWQRALKFLLAIYAIEIAPFLLTGNLGDVLKGLTWSLPPYAKPSDYPYFFWDITLPVLLFALSPILFGGLATHFRQKKYVILIGLTWLFVVMGYFIGDYTIIYQRGKPERERAEIQQTEREAQRVKKLAEIKSTLPVREPTYLPSFVQKNDEKLNAYSNGVEIYYNDGCFSIEQYPAPLTYYDSNPSSIFSKKYIDIGNGVNVLVAKLEPGDELYISFAFVYSNVAYHTVSSHSGSCSKSPQISEEELLKIIRSMMM